MNAPIFIRCLINKVHGCRKVFSYFAIVDLKEADVHREIQAGIHSIAEVSEYILG